MRRYRYLLGIVSVWVLGISLHAQTKLPGGYALEEQPADAKAAKIVFVAGSSYYKPGEHEYLGGCAVWADLVKQTPNVAPVIAVDWPKNPKTFEGAKTIVFFADGGDKHTLLKEGHFAQIKKLADAGTGLVFFHQGVDVPKDFGERLRELSGAAFEKGPSARAHWIYEFKNFPKHAITQGVTPFKTDDGYLFKLRFVSGMKGVTPLLRTVSPKAPSQDLGDDSVVAWAYDRVGGGRSFAFTGCHLHASLGEEGYRRLLTNGILWSAGIEIPNAGAPVALTDLNKYLSEKPAAKTK